MGTPASPARTVRSADVDIADATRIANGIEDLYDDRLDVIVVRRACSIAPLAATGALLDRNDRDPGWARPNQRVPVEDVQLLGTDTPATPTVRSPRGASLEEYLESAERHRTDAAPVFETGFDPRAEIDRMLARCAGGRPVAVPSAADGRAYVPFTLRRLTDGTQIGLHHDYHYPLSLYRELAPLVDTGTLVSWVVTLRPPVQGGDLVVYSATSSTPDLPMLASGHQYDLAQIEARFDSARFTMKAGDLFLLASGRCLHRVDRIAGPQARVTMGGFLALDRERRRVWYWS